MIRLTQTLKILLAAVLPFLFGACRSGEPSSEHAAQRVGVEEFSKLVGQGGYVLLDVRTPDEFASGHIAGARNLDVHSKDFAAEINRLDPQTGYLVYCRSGRRSQRACEVMASEGFVNLYELGPGFNGWQAADQAVAR